MRKSDYENYNSSKIYNSTIAVIYFGATLKPVYEINFNDKSIESVNQRVIGEKK